MFIKKDSATITCSTLGVGTGNFTTILNGLVHSFNITINKAVGAGSKVDITGDSTDDRLLLVADPSTLGSFYYPRVAPCNTSGNSTTLLNSHRMLHNEIGNILVDAGTSAIAVGTTTVYPAITVDIYIK